MKNNVAYVIRQMTEIANHSPVKKALQKMVFLIERKGVNLGFKYMLHFYGPYCPELDHETAVLSGKGVISFIYGQYGHNMNITDEFKDIESENLVESQQKIIQSVINRYKNYSASELELLTTAIYVYDYTGARTRKAISDNVKKIKGEKYSDIEIEKEINEFSYFGIAV